MPQCFGRERGRNNAAMGLVDIRISKALKHIADMCIPAHSCTELPCTLPRPPRRFYTQLYTSAAAYSKNGAIVCFFANISVETIDFFYEPGQANDTQHVRGTWSACAARDSEGRKHAASQRHYR